MPSESPKPLLPPLPEEPVVVPEPPRAPEFKTQLVESATTRVEAKTSQDSIAFFSRTPYDIVEENGEKFEVYPSVYVGTSETNRRKPQEIAGKFGLTEKVAYFVGQQNTTVKKGQLLLVPLPTKENEKVTLLPGARNDGKRLHASLQIVNENGKVILKAQDGSQQDLPREFNLLTDETAIRQQVYTYPPDKEGQIELSKKDIDEHQTRGSMRIVTVDGIQALLIEGIEGVGVQVEQQMLDRIKTTYEKQANRFEKFQNGALISEVHPEHPHRNEDAVMRTPEGATIVCDGMGGYEGGYANSRLAKDILAASIAVNLLQAKTPQVQEEALRKAVIDTHMIMQQTLKDKGDTTVTLSYVTTDPKTHKKILVWSSIGDSSIVVVRENRVMQVNPDDTKLEDLFHGQALNTWIPLPGEWRPLQNHLQEIGMQIETRNGQPHIFLWEQGLESLANRLRIDEGWSQYNEEALMSYLAKQRNKTSGVKRGIQDARIDIHSGIFPLEAGDAVLTGSDGIWDPVAQGQQLLAVKEGLGHPERIAKGMLERVHRANARVDRYHQRKKLDDATLVVEVVGK